MRVTAILNFKGGVGKTTTAINLAYNLTALHGKRVLLVDADSQGNSSKFFGGFVGPTLADLLKCGGDHVFDAMVTYPAAYDKLFVLPASDGLIDLDLSAITAKRVKLDALSDFLLRQVKANRFDHVIIDCPPALTASATAALIAADDVVIPMTLDAFAVSGMGKLMEQIANMRKVNPKLTVAGVLPVMTYASEIIRESYGILKRSGLPVFEQSIRRSPKVMDMTYKQEPLQAFTPKSGAAVDYKRFTAEFLGVK